MPPGAENWEKFFQGPAPYVFGKICLAMVNFFLVSLLLGWSVWVVYRSVKGLKTGKVRARWGRHLGQWVEISGKWAKVYNVIWLVLGVLLFMVSAYYWLGFV